jgi:hypothetical protein
MKMKDANKVRGEKRDLCREMRENAIVYYLCHTNY